MCVSCPWLLVRSGLFSTLQPNWHVGKARCNCWNGCACVSVRHTGALKTHTERRERDWLYLHKPIEIYSAWSNMNIHTHTSSPAYTHRKCDDKQASQRMAVGLEMSAALQCFPWITDLWSSASLRQYLCEHSPTLSSDIFHSGWGSVCFRSFAVELTHFCASMVLKYSGKSTHFIGLLDRTSNLYLLSGFTRSSVNQLLCQSFLLNTSN